MFLRPKNSAKVCGVHALTEHLCGYVLVTSKAVEVELEVRPVTGPGKPNMFDDELFELFLYEFSRA